MQAKTEIPYLNISLATCHTRLRQKRVWDGNEIKVTRLWTAENDMHMNVALQLCPALDRFRPSQVPRLGAPSLNI